MKNRIISIFLIAILSRCGGEFIPDPIDPRLPRYSEEGKDAAGCFINGDVWRAVKTGGGFGRPDETLRINFLPEDSTIQITIDGWRNELIDSLRKSTEIIFILDNRELQFESIRRLHRKPFLLDGEQNYGQLVQGFEDTIATNGVGKLTVRRANLGTQTSSSINFIVAGTFSFMATSDSLGTIEVKSGRFDYSVRESKN
ncbi:MAG: hypothetical protein AAF944_17805 [Bacteroidota bacterium]